MRKKVHDNFWIGVLYLSLALMFSYIFLQYRVLVIGDDTEFHIGRLNELIKTWGQGFPYLNTYFMDGIGVQNNIFYPTQWLYPLVVLIKCWGHPVFFVYVYFVLLSIATALITDYAVFSVCQRRLQSVLTAILYTFSIYRMQDFYLRFDLGELIGMTFLPLVFSGFYHVLNNDQGKWALGIGMTAMLYSHVMSTFLACIFLLVLTLIKMITDPQRFSILKNLLWNAILTLFLASAFIWPMLQKWLTTTGGLQAVSYKLYSVMVDKWFDQIRAICTLQTTVGKTFNVYTSGLFLISFGLLAGIWILTHYHQVEPIYFYIGVIMLVCFWLNTQWFPWALFDNSTATTVQFAFRFCEFGTFFASILIAYVSTQLFHHKKSNSLMCGILGTIACVLSLIFVNNTMTMKVAANDYNLNNQTFYQCNAVRNVNPAFDYFPKKTNSYITELCYVEGYINGKKLAIHGQPGLNTMSYHIQTVEPVTQIDLPFLKYNDHNYQVTHNGHLIAPKSSPRQTFLMTTRSQDNHIKIQYKPSLIDRYSKYLVILPIIWWGFIKIRKFLKPKKY